MIYGPLAACTLAAALAGAEPRQEISLNGRWQHRLVDDLSAPMPEDGFVARDVPGYLNGVAYRRAWIRQMFRMGRNAGPVPDPRPAPKAPAAEFTPCMSCGRAVNAELEWCPFCREPR